MRKNLGFDFNNRYHGLILSVLLFIVFILPFIILSFFTSPYLDDYVMPVYMLQNGGWWEWQQHMFSTYSARYFSTFLYLLSPTNYHLVHYYFILPLFLVVFSYFLIGFFIKSVFRFPFHQSLIITTIGYAFLLGLVFSPFEIFYWNASSLFYWVGFLMSLLLIFVLFFRFQSTKSNILFWIFLPLILIFSMGTNEISMFFNAALILMFCLYAWKNKSLKSLDLFLFGLVVIIILGSIFISGNFSRFENYENNRQIFWSIQQSFLTTLKMIGFQFQSPMFVLSSIGLLVFAPILVKNIQHHPLFKIQKSYWILLFSVGISVFSYFVAYFSLGENPPWRVHSIIQLDFFIGWIYFLLLAGLKIGSYKISFIRNQSFALILLAFFVWFSLTDFVFKQEEKKPISFRNNIPKAWYELIYKARDFKIENDERIQMIYSNQNRNLVFKKYKNPPEFLFFDDISTDSSAYYNVFYARYFHLNSVKIKDVKME